MFPLESLTLRDVHWDHLSEECQMALIDVFSSPNLTHVEFYNFSAPPYHIFSLSSSAPALRSFRTTFTPANSYHSDAPFHLYSPATLAKSFSQRVCLQFMEIGSSPRLPELADWLLDPQCPVTVSDLRHLRMTHLTDVPLTGQILRAASQSLERLELWAPTSRVPVRVGDCISITWMPALRVFQIKGLLFSPTVCSVPCLVDIFSVQVPHVLEEIHYLVDADNSHRHSLDWSTWGALDELLAKPMYRSLRVLDIKLHFARPATAQVEVAALLHYMPRLRSRGILSVQSS